MDKDGVYVDMNGDPGTYFAWRYGTPVKDYKACAYIESSPYRSHYGVSDCAHNHNMYCFSCQIGNIII